MNNTKTENAFLWGVIGLCIIAVSASDPIIWLFIVEYWAYIAAVGALMALSAVISGILCHAKGFTSGRVKGYETGYRHGKGIY